jgi:hypothetical protein
MHALTFDSGFSNNAVFILDGLKSSELQTAKHLHDELLDLAYTTTTPYCSIFRIGTRAELFSVLEEIKKYCVEGIKPIIHIEAHGRKDSGIAVGDNQEVVSWIELSACLGKINKISKNNLGVIMAGCFGLYAISSIKITQPTPYYFLIGSDDEVKAGEIDEVMKRFYRVLFQSSSLRLSMEQIEERFKQFHAERFFCISFGRYIKRACLGKGRATRVENLVSGAIERGTPRNRENLRKLRKHAKQSIKPSKATFDRYAKIFMHGRYAITYEQLYAFVVNKNAIPVY